MVDIGADAKGGITQFTAMVFSTPLGTWIA
jgi:hypothetical protein